MVLSEQDTIYDVTAPLFLCIYSFTGQHSSISPGIAVAPYPQFVIGDAIRPSDITGPGHVTEAGKGRDHTLTQGINR